MKKTLLKIGTIITVATPVAAVISCGSKEQTITNTQSTQQILNESLDFDSNYDNGINYDFQQFRQDDLDNHYTNWDAGSNTFSLDLASVMHLPKGYPIHQYENDSTILNDVFKRDGLLTSPPTTTVDNVSRNTLSTTKMLYTWYDHDNNGDVLDTPGMYHIRPNFKTDVFDTGDGNRAWNDKYLDAASNPIEGIKKIISDSDNEKGNLMLLRAESQTDPYDLPIGLPFTTQKSIANIFGIKYYTEWQTIDLDDNVTKGPLDAGKEGWYLACPSKPDGSAFKEVDAWGDTVDEEYKLNISAVNNKLTAANLSSIFTWDAVTKKLTMHFVNGDGATQVTHDFESDFNTSKFEFAPGVRNYGLGPINFIKNTDIKGTLTENASTGKVELTVGGTTMPISNNDSMQYIQPTSAAREELFASLNNMRLSIGAGTNKNLFESTLMNVNSKPLHIYDAIMENRLNTSFPGGVTHYSTQVANFLRAGAYAIATENVATKVKRSHDVTLTAVTRNPKYGYLWNGGVEFTDDAWANKKVFYTKLVDGTKLESAYWGFYETQPATVAEAQDALDIAKQTTQKAYAANFMRWDKSFIYKDATTGTDVTSKLAIPADISKVGFKLSLTTVGQYTAENGIAVSPLRQDSMNSFTQTPSNTYHINNAKLGNNQFLFAFSRTIESADGKTFEKKLIFTKDENGNAISTATPNNLQRYQLPGALIGFYETGTEISLKEFNDAKAAGTLDAFIDKYIEMRLIAPGDLTGSDGGINEEQFTYYGNIYNPDNVQGLNLNLEYELVSEPSPNGGYWLAAKQVIDSRSTTQVETYHYGFGFNYMVSWDSFNRFYDLNSKSNAAWPLPENINIKFLYHGVELKTFNNVSSQYIDDLYKMGGKQYYPIDSDLITIIDYLKGKKADLKNELTSYPFGIFELIFDNDEKVLADSLHYKLALELEKLIGKVEI